MKRQNEIQQNGHDDHDLVNEKATSHRYFSKLSLRFCELTEGKTLKTRSRNRNISFTYLNTFAIALAK